MEQYLDRLAYDPTGLVGSGMSFRDFAVRGPGFFSDETGKDR
jgi:hypothetical protein